MKTENLQMLQVRRSSSVPYAQDTETLNLSQLQAPASDTQLPSHFSKNFHKNARNTLKTSQSPNAQTKQWNRHKAYTEARKHTKHDGAARINTTQRQ